MTLWRTLKKLPEPSVRVTIEQGMLNYRRANGALTQIDIDHLLKAELRTIKGEVYWLLTDQQQCFALIRERESGMADVRRYLSSWRGFNYDGLCRFDAATTTELQLWPLPSLDRLAA